MSKPANLELHEQHKTQDIKSPMSPLSETTNVGTNQNQVISPATSQVQLQSSKKQSKENPERLPNDRRVDIALRELSATDDAGFVLSNEPSLKAGQSFGQLQDAKPSISECKSMQNKQKRSASRTSGNSGKQRPKSSTKTGLAALGKQATELGASRNATQKLSQTQDILGMNAATAMTRKSKGSSGALRAPDSVGDQKLARIQNLKDKALQLQLGREDNKRGSELSQTIAGSSSQHNPRQKKQPTDEVTYQQQQQQLLQSSQMDIFSANQMRNMQKRRDVARQRITPETKHMHETQEKFKKRYQFDRMSHQLLSLTPSNVMLSGSEHTDLAKYSQQQIYRNVTHGSVPHSRQEKENSQDRESIMQQDFESRTPRLPNIQRNNSASAPHQEGLILKRGGSQTQLAGIMRPRSMHRARGGQITSSMTNPRDLWRQPGNGIFSQSPPKRNMDTPSAN